METNTLEHNERIVKELTEHVKKFNIPHVFLHEFKKQLEIKSGSEFHGLINELVGEGILQYVQSNGQNTNVMFTDTDGKEASRIGYENWLIRKKELRDSDDEIKNMTDENTRLNYNWRYVLIGVSVIGVIVSEIQFLS